MAIDAVLSQTKTRPDAPAIVTPAGAISWRVLDEHVDATARQLNEAGAGPSDVVAIDATADTRTIIIIHAAWRLGVAVAPLHTGLTAAERASAVDLLDAFDPETVQGASGQTAAIVWTSGSSGEPRGVALPAVAFEHHAHATAERLGLESTDRWLTTLSFAHVGGLAMVARAAHLGSAIVLCPGFSATDFHDQCDSAGVTHASLVPTMLRRLLELDRVAPPTLRAVLLGGAAAAPELVRDAVSQGYPIALTYGLTEAASQIATATPKQTEASPSAVGAPLQGIEVKLDANGQILARGPTLATYVVGNGSLGIDADGWLHTGDAGSLDELGQLHVHGRIDARIITGGVNVDPLEVERALTALAGVSAACVVGVDDEEWGQRVEAAVAIESGKQAIDPEAVRSALKDILSAPKVPKRIHLLAELPTGRTGKVDRNAVRALLATT